MSWSNPTSDEAAESYSYYKNKYYEAANQKRVAEKQAQTYVTQRNTVTSQMNTLYSQKINFEKRLSGIDGIIKMLEGSGGWFSITVPDTIAKVVSSLNKIDTSYKKSIRMTGGVNAASLENTFDTKSVEGDVCSSTALQQYKAEKARIEQELANLNSQISSLSATISDLTSKINSSYSIQASLQASMNSYAYDMNHYRKYME